MCVLFSASVTCSFQVFPPVCGVLKGYSEGLDKVSKNFKYDDNRYYVNPVALFGVGGGGGNGSSSSTSSTSSRSRTYTVIVLTGKAAGGGTSGPVYITLCSHLGCTPELQLQVSPPKLETSNLKP